jgi:hypothetical protein
MSWEAWSAPTWIVRWRSPGRRTRTGGVAHRAARALAWLACAGLACPAMVSASTPEADTVRYTVLVAGRAAGGQEVWTGADGARHVRYGYEDRQRGPSLRQRAALGTGGVPVHLSTVGHDYLKNPVEETFTRHAATAAWRTLAGGEVRAPAGSAFYVATDEVPEDRARLVRALLAAPDRRLALLPGGAARVVAKEARVVEVEGRRQAVRLYLVLGLHTRPQPVWLDERLELFAQGDAGRMVIRAGWEPAAPRLVAAQDAALAAEAAALAASLPHRPRGPLVLRDASVFDARTARLVHRQAVVVRGDRIAWVGPDAEVAVPDGAESIDLGGGVLIPGLWDMHVHLREDHGLYHLAAGVTTVRHMGGNREEIRSIRRRIRADSLVGPRVLAAGMIDGPGPYAGPADVLVATPAEAAAAVDALADDGYVQIKIYSSVDTALVPVIVARARARGLRVGGHVPAFMGAEQAVRLGFDELNHANFLFLNFWTDSVPDTRTMARVLAVGERGAALDLAGDPVQRLVGLLGARGTVLDPTLNVFERLYRGRKGVPYPGYEHLAGRAPPLVRQELLLGGLPAAGETAARYEESFRRMLAFTRLLYDAGVPLVAGTDGLAGLSLPRELELYVEAGIPPGEVLRIATLGAARVMGMERDFGAVAPGKMADLVVIEGDPTVDIGAVRHVSLVVTGGRVYRGAELAAAAGLGSSDAPRALPAATRR